MPLVNGDVKLLPPRETWGLDATGQRVQVFELSFTVRGGGPYTVTVPMRDYAPQKGIDAITVKANHVIDTLDAFK